MKHKRYVIKNQKEQFFNFTNDCFTFAFCPLATIFTDLSFAKFVLKDSKLNNCKIYEINFKEIK